jgi:hypothetical protein
MTHTPFLREPFRPLLTRLQEHYVWNSANHFHSLYYKYKGPVEELIDDTPLTPDYICRYVRKRCYHAQMYG